ncbi:MAG: DUF1569 domain-containing protein [Rubripirellula sp.]
MSKQRSRRALKFDDLPSTVTEVEHLQRVGYSMVGRWNLAKACQHLSKTLRMSIEGSPFQLPSLLQPIARRVLFQTAMRGEPTRLPLKTARQFRPDEAPDASESIAEYATLVERVVSKDAPLLDVHPVFGRISKSEWRSFHAWHAAHHMSFLIPHDSNSNTNELIHETVEA